MLIRYILKENFKKIIMVLLLIAICSATIILNQKSFTESIFIEIIEVLPKFIQGVLFLGGFDITTSEGIYLVVMQYIALGLGFYSSSLALKVTTSTNKEQSDFVYVIVKRNVIFYKKNLANMMCLFIITAGNFLIQLGISAINQTISLQTLMFTHITLFITLLLFYYIFLNLGALLQVYKKSNNISNIIIIILYACSIFSYSFDLNWLNVLTPWNYLGKTQINTYYLAVSMTLIIITYTISLSLFLKSEKK